MMTKDKKNMKRKIDLKRIAIIGVLIVVVIALVLGIWFFTSSGKSATPKVDPKYVFDIYALPTKATEYQKTIFEEFRVAFLDESPTKDLENYAVVTGKNFIADFFTWSNKESRLAYGGSQFIVTELRQFFNDYAADYYKYLDHFASQYGRENLPVVDNIEVVSVTKTKEVVSRPEVATEEFDAYVIDFKWTYAACTDSDTTKCFPTTDLKATGKLTVYWQANSSKMRVLKLDN